MGNLGLDRMSLEGVTMSKSITQVYTAKDWGEFNEYVEENRMSHLFQRRLTNKAVEEALTMHPDLPVESFNKVSLNVRKV